MKKIFFLSLLLVFLITSCARKDRHYILSSAVIDYSIKICNSNNGLLAITANDKVHMGRSAEHEFTSDFSARCADGAVFYGQILSPNTEQERIVAK